MIKNKVKPKFFIYYTDLEGTHPASHLRECTSFMFIHLKPALDEKLKLEILYPNFKIKVIEEVFNAENEFSFT